MAIHNSVIGGGGKLPEGTTSIVKIFTDNGTWTVPKTGKYRVTTIGKGGDGREGDRLYNEAQEPYAYRNYGGGGTGAAAQKTLSLTKGNIVTISARYTASFGNYLSASSGSSASSDAGGNGGTASGGDINLNGHYGGAGSYLNNNYGHFSGGKGGAFAEDDVQKIGFLCTIQAENGSVDSGSYTAGQESGRSPHVPSASGMFPFGCGGGTGAVEVFSSGETSSTGGSGASGAVIIEMVLE